MELEPRPLPGSQGSLDAGARQIEEPRDPLKIGGRIFGEVHPDEIAVVGDQTGQVILTCLLWRMLRLVEIDAGGLFRRRGDKTLTRGRSFGLDGSLIRGRNARLPANQRGIILPRCIYATWLMLWFALRPFWSALYLC